MKNKWFYQRSTFLFGSNNSKSTNFDNQRTRKNTFLFRSNDSKSTNFDNQITPKNIFLDDINDSDVEKHVTNENITTEKKLYDDYKPTNYHKLIKTYDKLCGNTNNKNKITSLARTAAALDKYYNNTECMETLKKSNNQESTAFLLKKINLIKNTENYENFLKLALKPGFLHTDGGKGWKLYRFMEKSFSSDTFVDRIVFAKFNTYSLDGKIFCVTFSNSRHLGMPENLAESLIKNPVNKENNLYAHVYLINKKSLMSDESDDEAINSLIPYELNGVGSESIFSIFGVKNSSLFEIADKILYRQKMIWLNQYLNGETVSVLFEDDSSVITKADVSKAECKALSEAYELYKSYNFFGEKNNLILLNKNIASYNDIEFTWVLSEVMHYVVKGLENKYNDYSYNEMFILKNLIDTNTSDSQLPLTFDEFKDKIISFLPANKDGIFNFNKIDSITARLTNAELLESVYLDVGNESGEKKDINNLLKISDLIKSANTEKTASLSCVLDLNLQSHRFDFNSSLTFFKDNALKQEVTNTLDELDLMTLSNKPSLMWKTWSWSNEPLQLHFQNKFETREFTLIKDWNFIKIKKDEVEWKIFKVIDNKETVLLTSENDNTGLDNVVSLKNKGSVVEIGFSFEF